MVFFLLDTVGRPGQRWSSDRLQLPGLSLKTRHLVHHKASSQIPRPRESMEPVEQHLAGKDRRRRWEDRKLLIKSCLISCMTPPHHHHHHSFLPNLFCSSPPSIIQLHLQRLHSGGKWNKETRMVGGSFHCSGRCGHDFSQTHWSFTA